MAWMLWYHQQQTLLSHQSCMCEASCLHICSFSKGNAVITIVLVGEFPETLRPWQHKHPFTTLSCSLTFHFYWKTLQLLCLPNPTYRKQHSNWHLWDVWFNRIQKPEPVAPLPLVQGSCHESFLLILSLSRLQLQWHTHEICASLPQCAKWEQQHLIPPRGRVGPRGSSCLWILPGSSELCTLPTGETPTGTPCPTAMVGWGPTMSHSSFLQYLSERSRQICRWGPGHKAAAQGGQAGSQCMIRMSGSITQLKTSILQLSSQKRTNFPDWA